MKYQKKELQEKIGCSKQKIKQIIHLALTLSGTDVLYLDY